MLKVLLVDDESVIAQGLEVLIDWGAEGYEIAAVCSNGQEALDYLRQNAVDLVIADVMMPVMTGLELLEAVKRENISDAGFVILSGYSEFAFAQQALRFGCIDYLLKPIERDDLLAILHKISHMSENAKLDQQYEKAYLTRQIVTLLYGKSIEADIAYIRTNMRLSAGVRYIEVEAAGTGEFDMEEADMHILREQVRRNCCQILQEGSNHCVLEVSHNRLNYAVGLIYPDLGNRRAGRTRHYLYASPQSQRHRGRNRVLEGGAARYGGVNGRDADCFRRRRPDRSDRHCSWRGMDCRRPVQHGVLDAV